MTIFDTIKLAASNLWRRRMRTMLTVLGVVIGTACIIVMVTLGLSNVQQQEEYMASENLEIINVSSDEGGGGYGFMESSSSNTKTMNDSAMEVFAGIKGVKAVSPILSVPVTIKHGELQFATQVTAMNREAMTGIKLEQGELFTPGQSSPQFVMSMYGLMNFQDADWEKYVDYESDFYTSMYGEYDMYGNRIEKEETEEDKAKKAALPGPDIDWLEDEFTVVYGQEWGDMDEMINEDGSPVLRGKKYKGTISGIIDRNYNIYDGPYMDLDVAKRMIRDNRKMADAEKLKYNQYTQARVVAEDIEQVPYIISKLKDLGYYPDNRIQYIEEMKDDLRRQQSQLLMIAMISMLVSAIGIANTMLTTILERRSEIGVMKVVGMKIRSINFLFLTEATIIGMVGGLAGTLLSYLVIFVLNNSAATGEGASLFGIYFGEGVQLGIPIWLVLAAVGIAMATGLLSGVYPSWKATKMSPLEAIRST